MLFLASSLTPFLTLGVLIYLDSPHFLGELVIIAALLAVFALFFGYTLSQILVKPIEVFIAATRHVREGNLAVRIKISSKDELGRLAQVFNQMLDQLQKSYDALEAQQRLLQQKLEQRNLEIAEKQEMTKTMGKVVVKREQGLKELQSKIQELTDRPG